MRFQCRQLPEERTSVDTCPCDRVIECSPTRHALAVADGSGGGWPDGGAVAMSTWSRNRTRPIRQHTMLLSARDDRTGGHGDAYSSTPRERERRHRGSASGGTARAGRGLKRGCTARPGFTSLTVRATGVCGASPRGRRGNAGWRRRRAGNWGCGTRRRSAGRYHLLGPNTRFGALGMV